MFPFLMMARKFSSGSARRTSTVPEKTHLNSGADDLAAESRWSDSALTCRIQHEYQRFRREICRNGNFDCRRHCPFRVVLPRCSCARVLREGEPTLLQLANIWITINIGGGPTDDKREVIA